MPTKVKRLPVKTLHGKKPLRSAKTKWEEDVIEALVDVPKLRKVQELEDQDYRNFALVLFYLVLIVGFFFLMAHVGLSDMTAVEAGFAH